MEGDKKWYNDKNTRVIYTFDKEGCVSCLCPNCGSSIKRKFFLKFVPIKKLDGCINIKCENYYRLK
jgi:hypothetical protein